jgi:tetratricopeptide (TPR) repeat protein
LTVFGGSVISFAVAKALEQELKQPDDFVSFWTRVGHWLGKNQKMVIAAVVIGIVGVAVGMAVSHFRGKKLEGVTTAFSQISQAANAELLPKAAEKPEAAKPAAGVLKFKDEAERLEAVVKAADAFVAGQGADGLGRYARFAKAGRLVVLGKAEEAIGIYQQLLDRETTPDLRVIMQESLAAANDAAGKVDEALRQYTAAAEASARANNFLLDQILFGKARLLEKQGQAKDAEKLLREIQEKVPKSTLRREIEDRLAILGEK